MGIKWACGGKWRTMGLFFLVIGIVWGLWLCVVYRELKPAIIDFRNFFVSQGELAVELGGEGSSFLDIAILMSKLQQAGNKAALEKLQQKNRSKEDIVRRYESLRQDTLLRYGLAVLAFRRNPIQSANDSAIPEEAGLKIYGFARVFRPGMVQMFLLFGCGAICYLLSLRSSGRGTVNTK